MICLLQECRILLHRIIYILIEMVFQDTQMILTVFVVNILVEI